MIPLQTFITYHNSYLLSVKSLDNKRLNKQITEAIQILNICWNFQKTSGFQNHPAVKLWKGHEYSLIYYGLCCYREWKNRLVKGQRNGKLCHSSGEIFIILSEQEGFSRKFPSWLTKEFSDSHRSALLYKNYNYYSQFNWKVEPKINYLWPLKEK